MESDERNRLVRGIATARSWVEALVKGSVADITELARLENRTPRSIRMTLSVAFLDPALVEAACAGRWHLDEAFVKVNGKLCYLWRAVDHESERNPVAGGDAPARP